MPKRFFVMFGLLGISLWSYAQVSVPGWHVAGDLPRTPLATQQVSSALSLPMAAPMGAPAAPSGTNGIPIRIEELARSLQYDVDLIFDYVHNNIRYMPYWGLMKGSERTLLDRAGNDADQAALMVDLLRASGITANFVFGTQRVYFDYYGNDLVSWLGVDENDVEDVINAAAIPSNDAYNGLLLNRIWVEADGVQYDPAFKRMAVHPPMDILDMAGYSRSSFFSDALIGAELTYDYVQDMNHANIASNLVALTGSFLAELKQAAPNATFAEVAGGHFIIRSSDNPLDLWMLNYTQVGDDLEDLEDYEHTIKLQVGTLEWEAAFADISAAKVAVYFEPDGGGTKATVSLDDTVVAQEPVAQTGTSATMTLFVEHPYASPIDLNVTNDYELVRDGTYVLASGFGACGNGLYLKERQRVQLAMVDEGYATNSTEMVTEGLLQIGLSWMQETALSSDLLNNLYGIKNITHHRFGVVAQEGGYYIDVKTQFASSAAGNSYDEDPRFKITGMFQSALEHGVIRQLQGEERQAASTIELLHRACTNGHKVYLADSYNFSDIEDDLAGYPPEQLNSFSNFVENSGMLILPERGDLQVQDWQGMGVLGYVESGGNRSIQMLIGGDYYGGYNGQQGPIDPWFLVDLLNKGEIDSFEIVYPESIEPVNMVSGAYLFDRDDLVVDGPMGLVFSRHYDSHQRREKTTMGHGWKHSLDIHAQKHSTYATQLGQRTPQDAAAQLVACSVAHDLLLAESTPANWMSASLAVHWAMEQLVERAVSIHLGRKALVFTRQPDGTYTAPPGTTMTLEGNPGSYVLKERNGKTYAFNSEDRISTITDPDGNTLTFGYTGGTNLNTVASSFGGKSLALQYNSSNLVERVTDHTGRYVEYLYDADNNLESHFDPEQEEWTATYDDQHRIRALIDPEDIQTISNAYNMLDEVVYQQSATGHGWNFYFSGFRNIEEDAYGNQTVYYINEDGRTWCVQDALSNRTYTVFDGQGHVVETTDPNGVSTCMDYDADHNLLAQTNAVGTSEEVATHFGYDAEHHLRFVTNAVGTAEQIVTEYTYTTNHHIDTVTEAKGTSVERTTDYDYYPNGLLKTVTPHPSLVTTYTYDSYGFPDTVASTDAGTVDYLYSAIGDMKSVTVDGKTAAFGHDARRLPTATTNALGTAEQVVSSSTYWKNGLLKQTTDARGQVAHHYWTDAYKPAGVVFPNTGSTTNLYDEADRLVMSRDPEGNWSTNVLDAVGRIVEATSSSLAVTNQFDAIGNLTNSIVDPSGLNLWTATEYDNLNRPASVSSALSVVQTQYDALNRAVLTTDAAGEDWETQFDALGRARKTFRPSGSFEEFAYNALDSRTGFWNADRNTMTFEVDAQGRVTSITNALGKVTSFTFDDAGNPATRLSAEGELTQYGYDSLNRLVSITNESVEVATFDHDDNGNLVGHSASAELSAQSSFGYDDMNRLVASTQTVFSVSSVVQNQFDLNGNRTNIVYPGGLSVAYEFGADNRLESVATTYTNGTKTISFSYDTANRLDGISYPNGINSTIGLDAEGRVTNIVHGTFVDRRIVRNALGYKTQEDIFAGLSPVPASESAEAQTADAADRIAERTLADTPASTNITEFTYLHNDNGCLTSSVSSAESVDYTYDYDNRIASAGGSTSPLTEYLHDASGARVGRIHSSVTNYFVVDYVDALKRPLAETDSSGSVTRYYVWSGARLLCHIEADGTIRYYHQDELGSTLALTDSSGTVTDQFAYMPYGYANRTGTTQTPFTWLGGFGVYYDAETDLHLTLHRAYSADLKRFLQKDPLGIDAGANVYAYANLNPLFYSDSTGLWAGIDDAIAFGAGAIIGVGAQLVADAFAMEWSGWEDYTASALGGGIGGVAALYSGPVGAGAAGAASRNLIEQGLKNISGEQHGLSVSSFALDTTIGAATGGIIRGGRVPGVTAGRNSLKSISNQMITKFQNGTIKNVTTKTAGKMVAGRFATYGTLEGAMFNAVLDGTTGPLFDDMRIGFFEDEWIYQPTSTGIPLK